jgi:hypothetical protein
MGRLLREPERAGESRGAGAHDREAGAEHREVARVALRRPQRVAIQRAEAGADALDGPAREVPRREDEAES